MRKVKVIKKSGCSESECKCLMTKQFREIFKRLKVLEDKINDRFSLSEET